MPLVRFQVRNQYALAHPQLYTEANREDPKAVLDGVAVAGLVGILRQLGDLAEFAGEVFHGLQEQVMTTASRSHKLMVRVQNIEAALPPIEKAIQAQTSHIHFAYTVGSEWHPRIRNEQNHFIYNDLPQFIMDSYEECRDPPRLHLLDRFDNGGPGSCLKRYSDPTFFRRVTTNSSEINTKKIQKDKKARKIKKKRSSLRNGELSRGTSIYSCSGRMQFASPIVNGRTSPSHTASTVDMALKSDPGEHSNSLDSRTGSGYLESVFCQVSSKQSEEQDSKKASSPLLQHNDSFDLIFSDERSRSVDDNYLHSSFHEKIEPSSSCVSWEEKEEIVEPKGQQYNEEDEARDILLQKSETDTLNRAAINLRTVDKMDTEFDGEDAPASISGRSELDESESELDNFMDALNTIESESENDLDCQTKKELEQQSNFIRKDREDGMHELTAPSTDHHLSNNESDTASYNFSNKELPMDLPTLASSESFIQETKPQSLGISSNSGHSLGTCIRGSVDILDGSKIDSIIRNSSPSSSRDFDLRDLSGENVVTDFSNSQKSPEFSVSRPVKLWTNGGLLGLQPSKPPDFAVSNTTSEESRTISEKETVGPPNHALTIKEDEHGGKPGKLGENDGSGNKELSSRCSTMLLDDREDCKSTEKMYGTFAHANSNGEDKDPQDFPYSNTNIDANGSGPDVSAMSSETKLENDEKSSLMFGLSHRLLVNGFRRKLALGPDDKLLSSSSLGRIPETTFDDKFEREFPQDSLTSSPPLEHMKISFHPVNGCETSKLKLKFPNGNHSQESGEDMFPSFQLVPDSAIPLRDINSDSDDDTFCRSSPYMSDDCTSIHSESNSEQWEIVENPGNKDQELYDAFHRVSGSESVSSSAELWEPANNGIYGDSGHLSIEKGVELSLSSPLLDLPSLEVVNPVLQQGTIVVSDPSEPNPLPPPLPPVQWRLLKPNSEMEESQQSGASNAPRHELDPELVKPTISQQPKLAPAMQPQTNTEAVGFEPKSKDQLKMNGQEKANQASNGKEVEERGDFLHQIRTQSFNLRRTTTARPAFTSAPTSNVSVSAILEKANAIRQAVASDDGEEDTWSDS